MHPLPCLQHPSCSLHGAAAAPVRSAVTPATCHSPHKGLGVSPLRCHLTCRVPAAPLAHTRLSPPRGCHAALLAAFLRGLSTCCHQPPTGSRCTKSQSIPSPAGSLSPPTLKVLMPALANSHSFFLCPAGSLSLTLFSLLPPADRSEQKGSHGIKRRVLQQWPAAHASCCRQWFKAAREAAQAPFPLVSESTQGYSWHQKAAGGSPLSCTITGGLTSANTAYGDCRHPRAMKGSPASLLEHVCLSQHLANIGKARCRLPHAGGCRRLPIAGNPAGPVAKQSSQAASHAIVASLHAAGSTGMATSSSAWRQTLRGRCWPLLAGHRAPAGQPSGYGTRPRGPQWGPFDLMQVSPPHTSAGCRVLGAAGSPTLLATLLAPLPGEAALLRSGVGR